MKIPIIYFLLSLVMLPLCKAQTGIEVPSMSFCDQAVQDFMETFEVDGVSLAISKDGKLIYARSFGLSDHVENTTAQPFDIYRIASVSKAITGIAITKLWEDGMVDFEQKVFGPGGVMENNEYFNSANITDERVYDMTVGMLIEHSSGFDRDQDCHSFSGCDPIGFPLFVTEQLGVQNPVQRKDLVRFLLEKGLDFDPGSRYSYSNIGVLLVGLVIEEITGKSYFEYVKETFLDPLGNCDMHIGGNFIEDRKPREVRYNAQGAFESLPSVNGDGKLVPWQYGFLNIEAMDAHGGWIATATDLIRLLNAVDGFDSKPDLLSTQGIDVMTAPSEVSDFYGKGWFINSFDNWWHTGGLPGTRTIMSRLSNGFNFVVLINSSPGVEDGFAAAFDQLAHGCYSNATSFPTFDLSLHPTQNVSELKVDEVYGDGVDVSFASGSGTHRLMLCTPMSENTAYPVDGKEYEAHADFNLGDTLSDGSVVIYNGSGGSVEIRGLQTEIDYYLVGYEYTKSEATGNYPLYRLCGEERVFFTTSGATSSRNYGLSAKVKAAPNPAFDILRMDTELTLESEYNIFDFQGRHVQSGLLDKDGEIQISELSSGIYLLLLSHLEQPIRVRFIKE